MPAVLNFEEVLQRMKSTFVDPAGAGDNQVLAAPGVGFKIVVLGFLVMNNAATAQNIRFRSAANSKFPLLVFPAAGTVPNPPIFIPVTGFPLFECNENEALNINLSAATAVGALVQTMVVRV